MSLPLIALFLAAFAFGTTQFVIAGVLPQVATGLRVSIPVAGYLVSGYAIGVALGGPLLTFATTNLARRTLGYRSLPLLGAVALAVAVVVAFVSYSWERRSSAALPLSVNAVAAE